MNRRPQSRRHFIIQWWDQHFLFTERLVSLVMAGLFAIALLYDAPRQLILNMLSESRSAIYGALAAIFGSLLGFAITAVAIVLSFANSERMAVVRESEHYNTIWDIFKSCIRWLAAATMVAVTALIIDRDSRPVLPMTVLVVYTTLVGIGRIARTIWIFELLIGLITSRPRE